MLQFLIINKELEHLSERLQAEQDLESQIINKSKWVIKRINPFYPLLELTEVEHKIEKKEESSPHKSIIKKKKEEKKDTKSIK